MLKLYLILSLATVTFNIKALHRDIRGKQSLRMFDCTAVYISPTEALTAAHCVRNASNYMWIHDDSANKSYSAEVIYADPQHDLALITAPRATNRPFVNLGTGVVRMDPIYTYNSGDGIPGNWNQGIVSNLIIDPDTNTHQILHTASILSGASGSGLFDKKGHLIGINTMTQGAMAYAVDISEIRAFLAIARAF